MKTIAKISVVVALVLGGLTCAFAQSAASSSKNLNSSETDISPVQTPNNDTAQYFSDRSERGIPTPIHIEKLLETGKVAEALSEFEKFKAAQQKVKANPFHLLYCEMTIYNQAQTGDPSNKEQYLKKEEELRQMLISNFPDESDSYILQIDENTPNDKIIELATKAIELDPENIMAYNYRGSALHSIGKIKEACKDLKKLPWRKNMPEYLNCVNIDTDAE